MIEMDHANFALGSYCVAEANESELEDFYDSKRSTIHPGSSQHLWITARITATGDGALFNLSIHVG